MIISDIVYLSSLGLFAAGLVLNCYVTLRANRLRNETDDMLAQVEHRNRDFVEAMGLWKMGAAQEAIDLLRPHLANEAVRREVLR